MKINLSINDTYHKIILLSLIGFFGITFASAEATRDIFADGGLYDDHMNILNFNVGLTPPPDSITAPPNDPPPEGNIYLHTDSPGPRPGQFLGPWAGWGMAHVNAPGSFSPVSRDLREYWGGDVRFMVRSDVPLEIKIQYAGVSPDPVYFIDTTGGEWIEHTIPLSSIGATMGRLEFVRYPFIVTKPGSTDDHEWDIDYVRWTKRVIGLQIHPSSTRMNTDQERQFTVVGVDVNGEQVIITPEFITPNFGTLTTKEFSPSAFLTVNEGDTGGVIEARYGNFTVSATVEVTNDSLVDQFGILSDTIDGTNFDETSPNQNAAIFLYSDTQENESTLPTFPPVLGNSPEGHQHHKVVFNNETNPNGFQGAGIQSGPLLSPDTLTRDFSMYDNGSLQFLFKGPSSDTSLRDNLILGIRSGNVRAGFESSKVFLRDYVDFDDQWHGVIVPLTHFTGAKPLADLSRMKIYFNIAYVGSLDTNTEAERTVFLDNIRLVTENPGPLSEIRIYPSSDANPVSVSVNERRKFRAVGLDDDKNEFDISPIWDFKGASIGDLDPASGPFTFFTAGSFSLDGTIRASIGQIEGTVSVSVQQAPDDGSHVEVVKEGDQWSLLVDDQPYFVRGVTYSPATVGQSPRTATLEDWMTVDQNENGLNDFAYESFVRSDDGTNGPPVGDFQLMKEMGVNTIRLYHHASNNPDVIAGYGESVSSFLQYDHETNKELLRDLHETYGIRVLMGDFLGAFTIGSGANGDDGTDYRDPVQRERMLASVRQMVMDFKDEPFLLMYVLGNESNFDFSLTQSNAALYPRAFVQFLEEAASLIKSLDDRHPVVASIGDIGFKPPPQDKEANCPSPDDCEDWFLDLLARFAPSIDVFGTNAYRGTSFGDLWRDVKEHYDRPILMTEFGDLTPSITNNQLDEVRQLEIHAGAWGDIENNAKGAVGEGNAIGGTAFAWLDNFWQSDLPEEHNHDNNPNEFHGITSQGDGSQSPYLRKLRQVYFYYQSQWIGEGGIRADAGGSRDIVDSPADGIINSAELNLIG
ncbi:hypothetical protein BVX98_03680, partial [bacterium F11]